MKTPKTTIIFVLAVGVLLVSGAFMTNYYPAPKPVLAADGSPVMRPDGRPLVQRDMAKYYRVNRPAFILMGCSGCLFGWWLLRVSKYLYVCFQQGKNES
jgi:hypothetical protein